MSTNGLIRAVTIQREREERARQDAKPLTPEARQAAARAGKLNPPFPWQAIPFPVAPLRPN
jgi:hypothetical protein